MISIERVYNNVKNYISDNGGSSHVSSDEFNAASRLAELALYSFYLDSYEKTRKIPDAMRVWITPFSQLIQDSGVTIPSDWGSHLGLGVYRITNVAGGEPAFTLVCPADYAKQEEIMATLTSPIRAPIFSSTGASICRWTYGNGVIDVYPKGSTGYYLRGHYLKLVDYATRGYTVNVTTLQEDPNTLTTVDYVWPEQEETNLFNLILMYLGMQIQNGDVTTFAQAMDQKQNTLIFQK